MSKLPYIRVCKCGKKFYTDKPLAKKCKSCKRKALFKKKLKYNPLKVREAHNRDKYACRFCGINVANNPYTVKHKNEYYTACSSCSNKPKRELFASL